MKWLTYSLIDSKDRVDPRNLKKPYLNETKLLQDLRKLDDTVSLKDRLADGLLVLSIKGRKVLLSYSIDIVIVSTKIANFDVVAPFFEFLFGSPSVRYFLKDRDVKVMEWVPPSQFHHLLRELKEQYVVTLEESQDTEGAG
jgi:hypothetical protein